MHEIGASLGLDKSNLARTVEYLVGEGFLKYVAMGGVISLTHEGLKESEAKLSRLRDGLSSRDSAQPHRRANQTNTHETSEAPATTEVVLVSGQRFRHEFSDSPSAEDLLERSDFARALVELVAANGVMDPPACIAIDGEWGAGKSTILRWLANSLRAKNESAVSVDVPDLDGTQSFAALLAYSMSVQHNNLLTNALLMWARWRRLAPELSGDPVAFIAVLVLGIALNVSMWRPDLFSSVLATLLFVVVPSVAILLRTIAPVAGVVWRRLSGPSYRAAFDSREEFTREVELLASTLPKRGRPLYVLIDNLDRLRPSRIVQALEALSVLRTKNVITIVAVDTRVLSASIESELATFMGQLRSIDDRATTASYLERYFSLVVRLPVPTTVQLMSMLLHPMDMAEVRTDHVEQEREWRERRECIAELTSEFFQHFSSLLGRNPRRIKRFLLSCQFVSGLLAGRRNSVDFRKVAFAVYAVLAAAVEYPALARVIYDSEKEKVFGLLRQWQNGAELSNTELAALESRGLLLNSLRTESGRRLVSAMSGVDVEQVAAYVGFVGAGIH